LKSFIEIFHQNTCGQATPQYKEVLLLSYFSVTKTTKTQQDGVVGENWGFPVLFKKKNYKKLI
jgi:hypothetical protein